MFRRDPIEIASTIALIVIALSVASTSAALAYLAWRAVL